MRDDEIGYYLNTSQNLFEAWLQNFTQTDCLKLMLQLQNDLIFIEPAMTVNEANSRFEGYKIHTSKYPFTEQQNCKRLVMPGLKQVIERNSENSKLEYRSALIDPYIDFEIIQLSSERIEVRIKFTSEQSLLLLYGKITTAIEDRWPDHSKFEADNMRMLDMTNLRLSSPGIRAEHFFRADILDLEQRIFEGQDTKYIETTDGRYTFHAILSSTALGQNIFIRIHLSITGKTDRKTPIWLLWHKRVGEIRIIQEKRMKCKAEFKIDDDPQKWHEKNGAQVMLMGHQFLTQLWSYIINVCNGGSGIPLLAETNDEYKQIIRLLEAEQSESKSELIIEKSIASQKRRYGTNRDLTEEDVKTYVSRFFQFRAQGGKLPEFYHSLNLDPSEPRYFELETLRSWTKNPKFKPDT